MFNLFSFNNVFLILRNFLAINQFIKTIKKQEKMLTEFDEVLWESLLESATIKDKDVIVFRFKDGTEING